MQSSSGAGDGGKEARKVVLFPPESVKLIAESAGFEISDEIASAISDDATYRLREIVSASNQFLRHSKRSCLTVNDVNRALKWSDVPAIAGHSSQQSPSYVNVPGTAVWTTDDKEVNLFEAAIEPIPIVKAPENALRAYWTSLSGSLVSGSEDVPSATLPPLTETHQIYCTNVLSVLGGGSKRQLQAVMRDLQNNPNLGGLAPYLCLQLRQLMSKCSEDIRRKRHVMAAMQRLLLNKHLPFATVTGLDQMMEAAMELLLATPTAPGQSYQRDQAALLIGQATARLGESFSSKFACSLRDVMGSPVREVSAMIGCVKGAIAMGPQAVQECVMPVFSQLLRRVDSIAVHKGRSFPSYLTEAVELHGVLVDAVKCVVRSRMLELRDSLNNVDDPTATPVPQLCDMLNMLYQISAQHVAPFLIPSYPLLDQSFTTSVLKYFENAEGIIDKKDNAKPSGSGTMFKVPYPVASKRRKLTCESGVPRKLLQPPGITAVFDVHRIAPQGFKFKFNGASPVSKDQLQRKVQSALYYVPGSQNPMPLRRQRKVKLRRYSIKNIGIGALDTVL